ncbi:MAG: hypothetical protein IT297_05955 [Anaerolineae bacterium]|nr:hypothetical protein [Anaerolineae bacterium]MCZ7552287.1 glycosyl hydrolase [Anaerolineales bacterium]
MAKTLGFSSSQNKARVIKAAWIGLLLVAILLSGVGSNAQSAAANTVAAAALKITHGAHIRPTADYGLEIQNFNALAQKDLGVVMYFIDWSIAGQNGSYFDDFLANKIQQTFGANAPVIMLTWMPLRGRAPGCTKNYAYAIPLKDITAGLCDNYIRNFGLALKARPERYIVRFAHEMNLYSTPWSPRNFNQNASAYIAMYRHVYDVLKSANAENIEIMWSPNYFSDPVVAGNDRNDYYPGDAYVDWIGLSGFNYYTYLRSPWKTFQDLYNSNSFNYVLRDLACRYPKPQILAEIGTVEGPGAPQNKATWVTQAYADVPTFPFVRGVVWFNDYAGANPADADFRVTNTTPTGGEIAPLPVSGAWTTAYRQAIASDYYASALPTLAEATPPDVYCGAGQTLLTVSPKVVMIGLNGPRTAFSQVTGMLIDQELSFTLQTPGGSLLSGSFQPPAISPPWGQTTLTIHAEPGTPIGVYQVAVMSQGVEVDRIEVHVVETLYRQYLPVTSRN